MAASLPRGSNSIEQSLPAAGNNPSGPFRRGKPQGARCAFRAGTPAWRGILDRVEPAQLVPTLDQAVHGLPARGNFAVRVGPARAAGEIGSVMAHCHGFGSRGRLVMCRTRPMMRPYRVVYRVDANKNAAYERRAN